jgi:hypothetical protein
MFCKTFLLKEVVKDLKYCQFKISKVSSKANPSLKLFGKIPILSLLDQEVLGDEIIG